MELGFWCVQFINDTNFLKCVNPTYSLDSKHQRSNFSKHLGQHPSVKGRNKKRPLIATGKKKYTNSPRLLFGKVIAYKVLQS